MTNKMVQNISYLIDGFIMNTLHDNEITPDQMNGIILARLMVLNQTIDNADNFYDLLKSILSKKAEGTIQ